MTAYALRPRSRSVNAIIMDRQLIGLITFISICIVVSVLFHRKIKKPILAMLYSAVTSTILFQIIAAQIPFSLLRRLEALE